MTYNEMPKYKSIKCDQCGNFCLVSDLIGCGNEYEDWTECIRCCSDADLERTGKKRSGKK